MASNQNNVLKWLRGGGLERFYPKFRDKGITESKFIDLIVSDYQGLGITQLKDRQTLFRLIQFVKRRYKQRTLPTSTDSTYNGSAKSTDKSLLAARHHESPATSAPVTPEHRRSSERPRVSLLSDPTKRRTSISVTTDKRRMDQILNRLEKEKQAERNQYQYNEDPSPTPSSIPSIPRSRSEEVEHRRSISVVNVNEINEIRQSLPNSRKCLTKKKSDSKRYKTLERPRSAKSYDWGRSRIKVCVRKRPLNEKEKGRGDKDIAVVKSDQVMHIMEQRRKVDLTKYTQTHKFVFDAVFDVFLSNKDIYDQTCRPLIDFFFDEGKATCFAYGQTGSGKTYTMMGPEGGRQSQTGLYVLAAHEIFRKLVDYPHLAIEVSFFEIYGGKFFDLLNKRKKLQLQEDAHGAVHTVGLREVECTSANELVQQILTGNGARQTGGTSVHSNSSRSHAILQIVAKTKRKRKVYGSYAFIDLAGCERARATQKSERQRRIEGAEINKSLLALKECIRALDQNASHLPFRGSKLTQVLKDSFVGNCRTVMIATVAPGSSSTEYSLNTLRYASRVKEMKESKKKKSKVNAYMPHTSSAFARADTPPPESDDEKPEDYLPSESGLVENGFTKEYDDDDDNDDDGDSLLSKTWGGGSMAQALSQARKKSKEMDREVHRPNNRRLMYQSRDDSSVYTSSTARSMHRDRNGRKSMLIRSKTGLGLVQSSIPTHIGSGSRSWIQRRESGIQNPSMAGKSLNSRASLIGELPSFAKRQNNGSVAGVKVSNESKDYKFMTRKKKSNSIGNGQSSDTRISDVARKQLYENGSEEELLEFYQHICAQILEEEAAILEQHRRHIHETMLLVKEEMELLKRFEAKRLSVDDYVDRLLDISAKKAKKGSSLDNRVKAFKANLQEEELLNNQIEEIQSRNQSI